MSTVVEICNAALVAIGDKSITALADETDRARACNALWAIQRDAALRAHPWNFALQRASLVLDGTAPTWGFSSRFPLPTDPYCLRVLELEDADEYGTDWKIEGRYLLSDETSANILYIARMTDPTNFDTLFVDALVFRMASALAKPLTGNKELVETMYKLYLDRVQEARTVDGMEGTIKGFVSNALTEVR